MQENTASLRKKNDIPAEEGVVLWYSVKTQMRTGTIFTKDHAKGG
jgi:hypothetical protein